MTSNTRMEPIWNHLMEHVASASWKRNWNSVAWWNSKELGWIGVLNFRTYLHKVFTSKYGTVRHVERNYINQHECSINGNYYINISYITLYYLYSLQYINYILSRETIFLSQWHDTPFSHPMNYWLVDPGKPMIPNETRCYPLVNVYITMENHHFLVENPL